MNCPKCSAPMAVVDALYDETVHRCDACQGLFVRDAVLSRMRRQWVLWPDSQSHQVDSGDAALGRRHNAVTAVDCPECGSRMAVVPMADQPHITVEQCSACRGVFFDAGELTDLRHETFRDWIRDFLARTSGARAGES